MYINGFLPIKQTVHLRKWPKALSTIIEESVVCLRFSENGEKMKFKKSEVVVRSEVQKRR
jgi:hypothetical protein